jgi:hypothetical protein
MNVQQGSDQARLHGVANPFGVLDVPNAESDDVTAFAASVTLEGTLDDENAIAWGDTGDLGPSDDIASHDIEGLWLSRWNGGADPTIPGDATHLWKQGKAELKAVDDRVYLLFDWNNGARWGLIHARREGDDRLVGKYVNLADRSIMRPWTGLIVNNRRIDGRWPGGRLDFRRADQSNTDNPRS